MNIKAGKTSTIFKIWTLNQSAGLALGWFFHSLISHLWTGEHGSTLTTSQLLMHNVSLSGCALIVFYFQNKAIKELFDFSIVKYWWLYLTIPTLVFWLGYYFVAVPFDILFWFICLGFFNGIFISKNLNLNSKRWTIWSTLSGVIGFIVGAAVLYPLDGYLVSLKGLLSHVVSFSLIGIFIGIPMALLSGLMLRKSVIANTAIVK